MKGKNMMIALIVISFSIVTAVSIGLTQRSIPSKGTVYVKVLGVEVYWDPECTSAVTEIDWGVLKPSDSSTKTLYVKNTGNAAVTLSMATENWSPASAGIFITITWDAEEITLDVGAALAARIILSVSAEISGISDFSVDIVIAGSG